MPIVKASLRIAKRETGSYCLISPQMAQVLAVLIRNTHAKTYSELEMATSIDVDTLYVLIHRLTKLRLVTKIGYSRNMRITNVRGISLVQAGRVTYFTQE